MIPIIYSRKKNIFDLEINTNKKLRRNHNSMKETKEYYECKYIYRKAEQSVPNTKKHNVKI